ncbi:hypothetical protein DOTSEDRAFT_76441, partial [Dothistroma septosporum NZE10]
MRMPASSNPTHPRTAYRSRVVLELRVVLTLSGRLTYSYSTQLGRSLIRIPERQSAAPMTLVPIAWLLHGSRVAIRSAQLFSPESCSGNMFSGYPILRSELLRRARAQTYISTRHQPWQTNLFQIPRRHDCTQSTHSRLVHTGDGNYDRGPKLRCNNRR